MIHIILLQFAEQSSIGRLFAVPLVKISTSKNTLRLIVTPSAQAAMFVNDDAKSCPNPTKPL